MPKSNKMDNRGGYSNYSCQELFHCNVSFWFQFYCFVNSVVFLTFLETSLHWSFKLLTGYTKSKHNLFNSKTKKNKDVHFFSC